MSNQESVGMPQRWWLEDARAALSLGIWFGLLLVDVFVLSRGWVGALTVPLIAPVAWASCLIVSAVSVGALVLWRMSGPELGSRFRWLPGLSAMVWPVLWAATFSRGLSPLAWGGLAACAGMLFAATGLVWLWVNAQKAACEIASERESVIEERAPAVDAHCSLAESATDWQQRIPLEDGEAIEGSARVHFAAGQKEAVVHLAFCPPLARVPEVHAEDSEGADLEIRAEAVYPFGARLTVRRPAPVDGAASYDVAYTAAATEQSAAA